jgi:hypothetical protein
VTLTGISDQTVVTVGDPIEAPSPSPAKGREGPGTAALGFTNLGSQSRSDSEALPSSIAAVWGEITQADVSTALFDRLVRLATAKDGWRGAGTLSLRASSVSDFLKFWNLIKTYAVEPDIALAPDGSLHAEWFKSAKEHLDARFVGGKIVFGLIANKTVLEGADNFAVVAALLLQHPIKPLQWQPQ